MIGESLAVKLIAIGSCAPWPVDYTVDGDTITFSEVVMTKMACGGAGGQVEQAVLAVIGTQAPVAFAIDAGSLSFTSGAAGLQFSSTATQ